MSDVVMRLVQERGPIAGTVHSVFRGAVNLMADRALITVAADSAGGLPNGVLVHGNVDYRAAGLAVGMRAVLDTERVRIPAADLEIVTAHATPWSSRLPATDGARWSGRTMPAHGILRSAAGPLPGGLAMLPQGRRCLAEVGRSIARGDDAGAALAARTLIGLGPGLTPSGDDALAGFEAALRALGHPSAGFLVAALDDVDERTTAVSAAMLRHAVRGEFGERVHRLLEALLDGPRDALPTAIRHAVAWGATSGADGVSGVLAGLDAATTAKPARR